MTCCFQWVENLHWLEMVFAPEQKIKHKNCFRTLYSFMIVSSGLQPFRRRWWGWSRRRWEWLGSCSSGTSCFHFLDSPKTKLGQKTEKIGHRVEKLLCCVCVYVCVFLFFLHRWASLNSSLLLTCLFTGDWSEDLSCQSKKWKEHHAGTIGILSRHMQQELGYHSLCITIILLQWGTEKDK